VPFPRSKRTLYQDRPVGKRKTPAVSRRGSRFPWFSGLEADLHTELGVPDRVIVVIEIAGTRLGGLTDAEEQRRVRSDVVVDFETDLEDRQTTIVGRLGPGLVPVVIQLR